MRRVLKWIGIMLGVLLGLLVLAAILIFVLSSRSFSKTYDVEVAAVAIPDDNETLARGEYLANYVAPCTSCHGDNLGGMIYGEDPTFITIYAPNLTTGQGGVGATYSDEEWVRSVRHGVDPERRGLIFMPAQHFQFMSDEDLPANILIENLLLKHLPGSFRGDLHSSL